MITLVVLGSAQDGGVPHLGCRQPRCERARREPALARRVAALGVIDSVAQQAYLVDATPDVRAQLDALSAHPLAPPPAGRNPVHGLILTHAHIGHYTGLVQFGKEVMATRALPAYCTASMHAFLRNNGPWSQLLRDGHLSVREVSDNQVIPLTAQLRVRPFFVPHRQEWSDTLGLEFTGPTKRLLYIPDIDRWGDWPVDLRAIVGECDIALLDGTFHDGGELGSSSAEHGRAGDGKPPAGRQSGRSMADVPHPLMTDTMERLAGLGARVLFTHMNHTNPALDDDSAQRLALEARGFGVARDGMEFVL